MGQRVSSRNINGRVLDYSGFERRVRIISRGIRGIRGRVISVVSSGGGGIRRRIKVSSVVGNRRRRSRGIVLFIMGEGMQVGLFDEVVLDSGVVKGSFGIGINFPLIVDNVLVENLVFGLFNFDGSNQFKGFVNLFDKVERLGPIVKGSCYLDMIRTRRPSCEKVG